MRQFLLALTVLVPTFAFASEPETASPDEVVVDRWYFSLAVGYAHIETPTAAGKPIESFVLPSIVYYGEKFYLENFTMGYSLLETEDLIIDLQGRLNEDSLLFELDGLSNILATDLIGLTPPRGNPRNPPELEPIQRNASYMAGANFLKITPWGDFSLGLYQDVTNVHHGHEILLTFNNQFRYEQLSWGYELGFTYKSKDVVDYYYQLRDEETGTTRKDFNPEPALNSHMRVLVDYKLNQDWSAVAVLQYNHLASEIQRSPLIDQQDYWGSFVGFNYRF